MRYLKIFSQLRNFNVINKGSEGDHVGIKVNSSPRSHWVNNCTRFSQVHSELRTHLTPFFTRPHSTIHIGVGPPLSALSGHQQPGYLNIAHSNQHDPVTAVWTLSITQGDLAVHNQPRLYLVKEVCSCTTGYLPRVLSNVDTLSVCYNSIIGNGLTRAESDLSIPSKQL